MVELQILNRVLQTKDISIIEENQLDSEYFATYPDEYKFITEHYKEYGNVPDKTTFLSQFQDFEFVQVEESEEYLVNAIREQYLFDKTVPIVKRVVSLMEVNSNDAVEYLLNSIKDLQPEYKVGGTDIIKNAIERLKAFRDKRDNQENWFFTTGFQELDDIIHGISRKEEFLVLYARLNQGKSFILEKIVTHIWEIGFNVGYISPEMGVLSIGYRFDTLHKNFSNNGLMWGKKDFDDKAYEEYIKELEKHTNKFIVATPSEDFNNKITISKLRQFVKQHKLDILAIDGITYLSDERGKRNDNKTTSLTNISEDLKSLGMELEIPILVVVQANRSGVIDKESDELPELESIRDSDGIGHNATIVIALKQGPDGVMTMQVKKQRNGRVGDKISYNWSPDIGEFISENGAITSAVTKTRKKIQEKEDVF